ncbi:MAG: hypothetical protein IJZ57_08650 [Clostridia bacterium]|nr:hypothetical protein [Clostridia bacterium]
MKNQQWTKIVAIILSVMVIAYMTYNAFAYTYSPVTTERLTEQTSIEQTFEFKGFVLRDETAIDSASGGTAISLAIDGTRVAKGDCIAISCANNDDAAVYTRLEAAREEYDRLVNLNNQNGVNELSSEKLNDEIQSAYSDILDKIFSNDFSSLSQSVELFNNKSATKQILSEGSIDLSDTITALKEEIESLEAKNVKYTEIEAPASGYYINNLDGYEATLNYAEAEKLTAEQIEKAVEAEPSKTASDSGKLVSSYLWYLAGVVDTKYTKSFPVGKNITVNFPDDGLSNIQMKVESAEAAGGKLKVLLSSTLMNEELANMRIETVEIVEQAYDGYKIPSKAIRFDEENNSGVYVLRGKIISFIEVEILYTDEDYVIVSASKSKGKGLTLYDDVITKGRDLYDGKVIN